MQINGPEFCWLTFTESQKRNELLVYRRNVEKKLCCIQAEEKVY